MLGNCCDGELWRATPPSTKVTVQYGRLLHPHVNLIELDFPVVEHIGFDGRVLFPFKFARTQLSNGGLHLSVPD